MTRQKQDIVVGKVVAPFGVCGEVKVISLTEFPERFATGKEIKLRGADGQIRSMRIDGNRAYKDGFVLKLRGLDNRYIADELRGYEVVIDETELGELPSDRFYIFDLLGMKVVTDDGRDMGEVVEVLQGSNDVYITSTGLCIPALKNIVVKIDLEEGLMVIHPVPGLIAEESI